MQKSKMLKMPIAILLLAVLALAGCAKEEYRKQIYQQSSGSVGFRYLPAKVDIIIVPDNTDSANNAMPIIQANLGGFISGMQSMYWDYHVAKSDMINPSAINRVLVHPTYNSSTLSDGTFVQNTGIVPPGPAVTNPSNFSLLPSSSYSPNSDETFNYLIGNLNAAKNDTVTNFLRPDALLAVIVVTNGFEGNIDPGYNGVNQTVANNYAASLIGIKGNSSLIRYFPVSATGYHTGNGSDSCLTPGGSSRDGRSYRSVLNGGTFQSGALQGNSFDFCSSAALSGVLSSISQNLDLVRQSYLYTRIVLKEEPIESTLKVFKNGRQLINGSEWAYKGFQTNVPTVTGIEDPITHTTLAVSLNKDTGYVIELYGSGVMRGNDQPRYEYEKR